MIVDAKKDGNFLALLERVLLLLLVVPVWANVVAVARGDGGNLEEPVS